MIVKEGREEVPRKYSRLTKEEFNRDIYSLVDENNRFTSPMYHWKIVKVIFFTRK